MKPKNKVEWMTISTRAINFPLKPLAFDEVLREILKENKILDVKVIPEQYNMGYLLSFKLNKIK